MATLITILGIALAAVSVYVIVGKSRGWFPFKGDAKEPTTRDVADTFSWVANSPNGQKIYAPTGDGGVRVLKDMLVHADSGLEQTVLNVIHLYTLTGEQKEEGKKAGFTEAQIRAHLDPNKCEVAIMPSVLAPKSQLPAYKVKIPNGDPRKGSPYDYDGYMYLAGEYIGDTERPHLIAVADPKSPEHYQHFGLVNQHEREHDADRLVNHPRFIQGGQAHDHPLYANAPRDGALAFFEEEDSFQIVLR